MGKVVRLLASDREAVILHLEEILERIKAGEVTSYVFAAQTTDGEGITSWWDGEGEFPLQQRQFLVSMLQVDINVALMELLAERMI